MMLRAMLAATLLSLLAGTASAAPSALVDAAQAPDSSHALALIAQGADVNATAPDGTTPLMWAVYRGDYPLVQALLKAHAKVDASNAYGANAMLQAAQFGDLRIIEALLKAGANVESPNPDGETALMLVARAGNVEAAQLLLKHGANVNARENFRGQTALIWAAAESQPEMVKVLVAARADVNARSLINTNRRQVTGEPRAQARPPGGMTPLLYAARQGCLGCIRHLAEGHADLNLADPEGITPMLIATENFNFDIAAYLLKSQQIPSVVALGVLADPNGIRAAGGAIVQALPGAPETTLERLEETARAMTPVTTQIDAGATPEDLAAAIAAPLTLRPRGEYAVQFSCRCSRVRVETALLGLGREELERIAAEEPQTEAVCEFCKHTYTLSNEEVRALVARLA